VKAKIKTVLFGWWRNRGKAAKYDYLLSACKAARSGRKASVCWCREHQHHFGIETATLRGDLSSHIIWSALHDLGEGIPMIGFDPIPMIAILGKRK
jgi:hypothetical protein